MKPWTVELIVGIAITSFTGIVVALLLPVAVFLLWLAGVAMGYGLRIGIVNVWPRVFRPRRAYENQQTQLVVRSCRFERQ